jgi:DNA-binding MarR family transcriptional regulator
MYICLEEPPMNFYSKTGELLFGTWLKRISSQFQQDILGIYAHQGIRFELSWFPVFYILGQRGEYSVTQLASELEVSHPALIQVLIVLETENYVSFSTDRADKRKRVVRLTTRGSELLRQIEPIWERIKTIMDELFEEGKYTKKIIQSLSELEENMKANGLLQRYISEKN